MGLPKQQGVRPGLSAFHGRLPSLRPLGAGAEKEVLGLLAAVRVHGDKLLAFTDDSESHIRAAGRWIAARWKRTLHEPLIPEVEVALDSVTGEWRPVAAPSKKTFEVDAVLFRLDDWSEERLPYDRVVRAVEAIRAIEGWGDRAAGLKIVRTALDFLAEARSAGFDTPAARRPIRKAARLLKNEIVLAEEAVKRARKDAGDARTRIAVMLARKGKVADPTLQLHAMLEEAGRRERRRVPMPQVVYSVEGLKGLLARVEGNVDELDAVYAWMSQLVQRRPRANIADASTLHEMIERDGWSALSAARLWSRVQFGPNTAKERALAQAVDSARRARKRKGGMNARHS